MPFRTEIKLDDVVCIYSVPQSSRAWQKATSVFCPLGPSHTRVYVLLTRQKLDAVEKITGTHKLTWTQFNEGEPSQPTPPKILEFSGLYLVASERLTAGDDEDPNALFLVELADARLLCARKSDSGSIHANIRSYAQDTDYLTDTEGYTWESLITELWNACELLGSVPSLPFTPDGLPENTRFIGVNAYEALSAVLDQLDCALCHNPLAGTYSIVQLGATQEISIPGSQLKWSGEPRTYDKAECAQTVRVYFHTHFQSYGQEADTGLANWSVDQSYDHIDVATGIEGAQGIVSFWDDLPRLIGEDNLEANTSAMNTRATARKDRYVTRWTVKNEHKIAIGLHPDILPGGKVRAVIWRNYDDGKTNRLGGTVTEYVSRPQLVTGMTASSSGVQFTTPSLTIARENYAPPDLGRHSFPNYPRLSNVVQVYHSAETAGQVVEANTEGYHPGKVRRWVAGALSTLEDCWIRFVDFEGTDAGAVMAFDGQVYGPARLSGIATSDETDTRPIYIVTIGQQSFLGVTQAEMTQGGTVDVEIYYRGSTDWEASGIIIPDCLDWYLNTGQTIAETTKVEIRRIGSHWTIVNAYCDPTDLDGF